MDKKIVTLKSTKSLADNTLNAVKGKKLILVGEITQNEKLHFILENPEGIKVIMEASNCQIITNKKNK